MLHPHPISLVSWSSCSQSLEHDPASVTNLNDAMCYPGNEAVHVHYVTLYKHGVVRCGVVRCGAVRCGAVWFGTVWCGAVWCGVVQYGVVRCGVVWCGAVWCGVV